MIGKLILKDIQDPYVQENFLRLQQFLNNDIFLNSELKFFEVTFTAAVTNFRFKHNLGYLPKDAWLTGQSGTATVTFNHSLFSKDFLDITTSAATTIRFLAGRFRNDLP